MDVSDAIRDYALRKLGRMETEFSKIENVHIILDIQRYLQIVKVTVQGKPHLRLEAEESSEDMYTSIDKVSDKIEKQLRKIHERVIEKKSRPSMEQAERVIVGETEPEQA